MLKISYCIDGYLWRKVRKKMHKKKYCFIIITLICSAFMITGCSNNRNVKNGEREEETATESSSSENTVTNTENNTENVAETSFNVRINYRFNEGVEWIQGDADDLGSGYACIDKEGNALFFVNESEISNISPFSNGYSFIETENAVYQIDLNGNIINKYDISDNIKAKAYDGGQIWIEEYNSNFDSAGYVYKLYDESGNEITEFSIEGTDPVNEITYCGKGVWSYGNLNNDGNWVRMYYCTQGNKWVEKTTSSDDNVYFYEDTAVLGFDYEDPNVTGYRSKMILMDIMGNLNEIAIIGDLGWNWGSDNYINEGYCILEDYGDHLVSYNVSSGEFKVMDNEYAEKIRMAALPDNLVFEDGCVALPLRGNDEKDYVALFDTSWNIIGEPIQGTRYDFSEGKLIVEQNISSENQEGTHLEAIVYNTREEKIFSAFEKGYATITFYKDGVAYILDETAGTLMRTAAGSLQTAREFSDIPLDRSWKCVNENGDYLFDTINMGNIKTIELI